MEWLYHIGVPEDQIEELAETSANTVPCMMPYITAFFMPRAYGDRPDVVPAGAVNFAFLGQFAETKRDTIFTTEYSMRTGMEAVYTLLNVDRGVPEVWGSVYDLSFPKFNHNVIRKRLTVPRSEPFCYVQFCVMSLAAAF